MKLRSSGGNGMKISIERDEKGLHIDLGSNDWDHYEVVGMLEEAKRMIQQEVDRLRDTKIEDRRKV